MNEIELKAEIEALDAGWGHRQGGILYFPQTEWTDAERAIAEAELTRRRGAPFLILRATGYRLTEDVLGLPHREEK